MNTRHRLRLLARAWIAAIIVLAVVVVWPALKLGVLADDLFQVAYVDGLLGPKSPLSLYFFVLEDPAATARHIELGTLPWWTTPEFRFAHLRPLSSLLVWFDQAVLPRDSVWPHVHSMLWLVALLIVAARVLPRLIGWRLALPALLVFALEEPLGWTVGWLANRCAMVSCTFGLLAVDAYVRRRGRARRARPREIAVEFGWWFAAFAAGEYALSVLAYAIAWELGAGRGGRRERAVGLLPAMAVLGLFTITYLAIGCGVYGATTYVDPFTDFPDFVRELGIRGGRMLGELVLGIPGETERLFMRYGEHGVAVAPFLDVFDDPVARAQRHAWLAGSVSVVTIAATWWLVRRWLAPRERRGVAVLGWGAVLGLLPLAAIPPTTRALLVPGLGVAAVCAAVFVATVRAWGRTHRPRLGDLRRWSARVALSVLAVVAGLQHVLADALFTRVQLAELVRVQSEYHHFFDNPRMRAVDLRERHVILVAAPGLVTGIYGLVTAKLLLGTAPRSWQILAMGVRAHVLRVIDEDTLELSSVGEAMHADFETALFRAPRDALHVGDVVDAGVFRAEVIRVRGPEGPSAVWFHFDRPLDDPSLLFIEAGPDGLQPMVLPPPGRARAVKPPRLPVGPR